MKKLAHFLILILLPISLLAVNTAIAAVPTEEGLLKNLNNAVIPGNLITIKSMVQSTGLNLGETDKGDFYKFILSLENPSTVALLQVDYSSGQMLATQIKDVKYIPDLVAAIRKEKSPERAMFYAALVMLATNKSQGMESFLEKSGVQIVRNKNILNEEKMKLLRSYRTYLANNKGRGDANSPLNPPDPANKAKVIELFKANTFERSKNVELTKLENEFFWKVDWKNIQAYFSNEERRLRRLDYSLSDGQITMTANDYLLFNGTNELPKFMTFKDSKGQTAKMQILGLDTKTNREKKLYERYEEAKKVSPAGAPSAYSFLF